MAAHQNRLIRWLRDRYGFMLADFAPPPCALCQHPMIPLLEEWWCADCNVIVHPRRPPRIWPREKNGEGGSPFKNFPR